MNEVLATSIPTRLVCYNLCVGVEFIVSGLTAIQIEKLVREKAGTA